MCQYSHTAEMAQSVSFNLCSKHSMLYFPNRQTASTSQSVPAVWAHSHVANNPHTVPSLNEARNSRIMATAPLRNSRWKGYMIVTPYISHHCLPFRSWCMHLQYYFVLFWLSCWYWCMHLWYLCLFECVKCFNIDVCTYSTCSSSSSSLLFVCFVVVASWLFVMLILMNAFIVLVLFWSSSGFWCW